MKKTILFILAFGFVFSAQAQFPLGGAVQKPKVTGRITAVILDSLTKKPIDYASVSLLKEKDNKSVNGAVSDERGKVSLQNVTPDQYKMSIGFMGYKSRIISVKTTPEKPDLNAGTIYLSPTESTLKEVAIVGAQALIENKVDKLVYNAEADATNAGGDATDVMRKVPMLSVDMNGNVQLRGSAVRILINGKPSGTMANSVADALKMIPAEQIKSVEVITSPSAKYDAEGSGGIINIITKKKTAEGTSGSINATAGTRSNNGAFNFNVKTGRLAVTTSLGVNHAYPQKSNVVLFNSSVINGVTNTVSQNGYSDWSRVGYNGSVGLDYDINGYNNISSTVKLNRFSNGGPGTNDILVNQVLSQNIRDNDMSFNNMDWNVDYRKTSKKEGEEFSISAQLSTGRNESEFTNRFLTAGVPEIVQFRDNTGKNNEYTLQADYTYPFSKTTTLETGLKGIVRNIVSDYDLNAEDFDYDQNVASAYGVIGFKLTPKITAKAGLRAEYTMIDGMAGNTQGFNNDYFNLFPSLIVSQTLKGMTTIKLSYNRRVQRPSLFYLNPFRNESDIYNPLEGNPKLSPELTDNIEFGYSTFIKGSVINASVFYRSTQDVIESSINPVTENGVNKNLTTYINVGTSQSYGFNLFGSYNPKPKWTLMSNFGLNTYEVNNAANNISTGTLLNYTIYARSAYAFSGGWNTELWGVINSPKRTFQGKTDAMYFYGGAVKKEIFNKTATIGLNVLNPFSRDLNIKTNNSTATSVQRTDIHYPLRSFGLNFSYKFGKLKFTEKKTIKNDDLKKEDQGGMGGGVQQQK
ncbi:outer membrane beta-barrel family protein [Pedobacter metabolipauper]|uniref:Outer membrane receptor protein involved in Fe transport n=1 Tax=Pedobacter metabolipauper TaxID=425513 RepID=A0A4R6SVN9_9SPHI|nr:outer membrane beta-barrel family protein [Pedobacter metabolipauper]TDQ08840.1 outer membrane receptor protein involved in Fe transport [Pedobacter metabolipauper]